MGFVKTLGIHYKRDGFESSLRSLWIVPGFVSTNVQVHFISHPLVSLIPESVACKHLRGASDILFVRLISTVGNAIKAQWLNIFHRNVQ